MNGPQPWVYYKHAYEPLTQVSLKVKTVDFSETIAASDLKVGKCRQLIELIKI